MFFKICNKANIYIYSQSTNLKKIIIKFIVFIILIINFKYGVVIDLGLINCYSWQEFYWNTFNKC